MTLTIEKPAKRTRTASNPYRRREDSGVFTVMDVPASKYSPNKCVLNDGKLGLWLWQANCIEFMDRALKKHPLGVFDMIFADPPYFLSNGGISCRSGKMVKVDKGDWDKSQGPELNHEFNTAWLSRCKKLLKPNGTLWVSGTHHVIHSVGFAMQQLDMKILNDITWQKPNPPPNLSCRYFTHASETIIWASKNGKAKHTFNYDEMRSDNSGKQMKSIWDFTAPGKAEKTHGKHPTQKPLQLLERIIRASTKEGDLIFDPFAGSATTGVAAVRLGRKFAGCELEEDFVKVAKKRLKEAMNGNGRTAAK